MNDPAGFTEFLETCWHYLLLGVVQGLTEFLPISSTAHVKVLPILLGWGDPGTSIAAVIQLGSIFAVLIYFRKDLKAVIRGISRAIRFSQWSEPDARLGIAIGIGTVPIIFAGMIIKIFWPSYNDSAFRSIPSIAIVSILMACLLALSERTGKRVKSLETVQAKDGFIVGIGQMLALIPGVSRSGITLTISLLDGWQRDDAARFSFLLGIPSISLAGLVELKSISHGTTVIEIVPLLLGIASAAIVSWLSIDWLLIYLQRHSTSVFVVYRLLFGVLLLGWWLSSQ